MPAPQIAMLVREGSFGTPVASPVKGTDLIYLRLENPIEDLMTPVIGEIQHGGGLVTPACFFSDQYTNEGTLSGTFYTGYSKLLLDWATTPIDTGRTAPWTTTDPDGVMLVGDLASLSVYDGVLDGSTYTRRRGSGRKCRSLTLQGERNGDGKWTYNAAFVGIRDDTNGAGSVAAPDATEFPEPAAGDLPCNPWQFSHAGGGLKIGTSRTMFDSVAVTIENTLTPGYFESRYPMTIRCFGRKVTLAVGLYRKPTTTDLAAWRALTSLDSELTLYDGTRTLKFDFNTNGRWTAFSRNLPTGSYYRWVGTITAAIDNTVGTDFSFTYTP